MKHRKKWAVVCYAGLDAQTKKQRQRWFGGFKTHAEAEQFRLALAHSPAFSSGVGPYGSPRLRTGDYLRTWHEQRVVLGKIREQTADRYEELLRCHIIPGLGHIPLARLAPAAIQHFYTTMISERGLSTTTAHQAAAVLHVALRDATRQGLIVRNPADNTTPPPVAEYEPTVFSPEQTVAYLADARTTATPAVYALHVTAATGGLRLGELLGLREVAADLAHRPPLLSVHQQLVRAGRNPVYGPPKTGRGRRTIVLSDVAADVIRAALLWKKAQRLMLGPKYRDSGLLFVGPKGRPLNPSNLWNRDHTPRLRRLGLPHSRLHDLRHFHGTQLAVAGVDARTIADRLGHSKVSFTLDTYVHPALAAQEQAAAAANDWLTKSGLSAR
ncbi:MAG TPA: tyrosine-type recombinase/integrase [bacterium]|nr:tyrosine-type recombinase/integrase [bacterium]